MPRERIAMHHIEEILRLRHEAGRTQREIASGCGMSQSRVQKVLARARAAGVGWPQPAELDEGALQELIYGRPAPSPAGVRYRTEPDFEYLHRELKRHRHVTLQLLWEEYREQEPAAATATAASANCTGGGARNRTWSCARSTGPGRRCSSTTPGPRSRWTMRRQAGGGQRRCSWRCWA